MNISHDQGPPNFGGIFFQGAPQKKKKVLN
jgi:hypothetical protein